MVPDLIGGRVKEMAYDQGRTPLFDALKRYIADDVLPMHVPGHKQGRGLPEFQRFVGKPVLAMDLTCLPDLDNICNPRGVLAEAEALAAQAYGAEHAYFLVNGTTAGIQTLMMAVCRPGEEIIIPRNAHKSAMGGLVLSGARPVYIEPEMNREFGISMGITPERVEKAIRLHPRAKAVFVVYPNYYGTACDLEGIVRVAHSHKIPVIVDEAHGAHFHFHPDLPPSAMECGADLVAASAHKLTGSMTQSSLLLMQGRLVDHRRVKAALNLTQTTSPSYVLLASLDVARKQMALHGRKLLDRTLALAQELRQEVKKLPGLVLLGENVEGLPGCQAVDPTKVTINVQRLGITGYEAEKILRRQFHLQVELSDLYNIILLVTIGDDRRTIARAKEALRGLVASRRRHNLVRYCPPLPDIPPVGVLPREAFYGEKRRVPLEEAAGEISAETITAYPPGIPLVCAGEYLTREVLDYIQVLKAEHAELQGAEDPELKEIQVLKKVSALASVQEEQEQAGTQAKMMYNS